MKKLLRLPFILLIVLLLFCTLPNPVETVYEKSVSINALLVAGKTLDSVWVTRNWSLDETYDSAYVVLDTEKTVIIVYQGSDLQNASAVDTLSPYHFDDVYPHDGYYGHDTIQANTRYSLHAELVLTTGDTFILEASTRVPEQVHIDSVAVPLVLTHGFYKTFKTGNPQYLLPYAQQLDPDLQDSMFIVNEDGDTLLNYELLAFTKVKVDSGDTLVRMYGDEFVFMTTVFIPAYPVSHAKGLFLGHSWSDSVWVIDTTTIFGGDTIWYPRFNRSAGMGGSAVPMDSLTNFLTLFNSEIVVAGENTFQVYGIDSSYYDYLANTGAGIQHSNIEGGYGYFSSATVDSVSFYYIADGFTKTLTDSLRAQLDSVQDSLRQEWEEMED